MGRRNLRLEAVEWVAIYLTCRHNIDRDVRLSARKFLVDWKTIRPLRAIRMDIRRDHHGHD